VYYAKGVTGDSCGLSKFFITFNMLLGVVTTIASLNGKVQEHTPTSGILQAGVVFFYTTYLTWSAVSGVTGPCSQTVWPPRPLPLYFRVHVTRCHSNIQHRSGQHTAQVRGGAQNQLVSW